MQAIDDGNFAYRQGGKTVSRSVGKLLTQPLGEVPDRNRFLPAQIADYFRFGGLLLCHFVQHRLSHVLELVVFDQHPYRVPADEDASVGVGHPVAFHHDIPATSRHPNVRLAKKLVATHNRPYVQRALI